MTAASVAEVLGRCSSTTRWTPGMCGQFCAVMYGYGASGYNDALTQWQNIPGTLRRPGSADAPAGCLLFWGGGSQGHGHVAVSAGDGTCYSIDIAGAGTVTRCPVNLIHTLWGLPFLGWSVPYFQGDQWLPMSIYGIDVSDFQPINFALTTPQDGHPVDFAIIKVTEGSTWTSARWKGQQLWARDHGLAVGYYHFGRPGSMVANADHFLGTLGAIAPGESLWFDWEDAGITSAQKDQWIKYTQSKMPGFRVGMYCNTSFWKTKDTSSFAGDGLWIADPNNPVGHPNILAPWLIQQYSSAGDYDHNFATFASRDAMIEWAGGDVALTQADIDAVAAAVANKLIAGGGVLESSDIQRIFATDGILPSPADAVDHATNPYWAFATYVTDTGARVRAASLALDAILKQAQSNGSGITALGLKLDAVAAALDSIDLSQLPAEIAAKLESLKLVVSVTEGA